MDPKLGTEFGQTIRGPGRGYLKQHAMTASEHKFDSWHRFRDVRAEYVRRRAVAPGTRQRWPNIMRENPAHAQNADGLQENDQPAAD